MFPTSFEYYRASSVEDAVKLLGDHDDAKVLAGGHSLLPTMKLRLAAPSALIDIGRIADLRGITKHDAHCTIGALTTHDAIATSSQLAECCPVLAEAAGKIGDPAVRNKGTIGGNIAHADPASDLPAVLVALGGTVHLHGKGGKRSVAIGDFFVGLLATDVRDGEILTAVDVPCVAAGTGTAYAKFEHPASGYAVCGAAAIVTMEGGKCTAVSLAFNGIADVPASADLSSLVGTDASDEAIKNALASFSVDDPLGDTFASGEYRIQLAKVYGARALAAARDRP